MKTRITASLINAQEESEVKSPYYKVQQHMNSLTWSCHCYLICNIFNRILADISSSVRRL